MSFHIRNEEKDPASRSVNGTCRLPLRYVEPETADDGTMGTTRPYLRLVAVAYEPRAKKIVTLSHPASSGMPEMDSCSVHTMAYHSFEGALGEKEQSGS